MWWTWDLSGLKGFLLWYNLWNTTLNISYTGKVTHHIINASCIKFLKEKYIKNQATKKPKVVLPESPKNILLNKIPKFKKKPIKIQNIKIKIKLIILASTILVERNIRDNKEIITCEEQKPSMPSIKLKAFVKPTTQIKVTRMLKKPRLKYGKKS